MMDGEMISSCRCNDSYAGYQLIDIMAKAIKQRDRRIGDNALWDICTATASALGIDIFKCGEHYKAVVIKND